MKWEVKKVGDKWGVFLIQKYCKTSEEVCYCVSFSKRGAAIAAYRLNNPLHIDKL
tara:strand:- start:92 stop:256 length:165 start_codon:yes stop_codon:yes gene_type:complete